MTALTHMVGSAVAGGISVGAGGGAAGGGVSASGGGGPMSLVWTVAEGATKGQVASGIAGMAGSLGGGIASQMGMKDGAANGGSTGRTTPNNLNEQLAMQQVKSNPGAGQKIPIEMKDSRWPASDGWIKMRQNVNGVEVHYVYNTRTGAVADFKFK